MKTKARRISLRAFLIGKLYCELGCENSCDLTCEFVCVLPFCTSQVNPLLYFWGFLFVYYLFLISANDVEYLAH